MKKKSLGYVVVQWIEVALVIAGVCALIASLFGYNGEQEEVVQRKSAGFIYSAAGYDECRSLWQSINQGVADGKLPPAVDERCKEQAQTYPKKL